MRDLHLHLSGATPPVILWELIRESGFKNNAANYFHFKETLMLDKEKIKNLDDYLNVLHTIDKVQSSPLAIEESVYSAYVESYLNGCKYLELRWNPTKRSENGSIDLDRLIVAARAGKERANAYFGISGSFILCLGRDVTKEANKALFKKAMQYHNKGVIGIDIAGPYFEPKTNMSHKDAMKYFKEFYEYHDFINIYNEARELGMLTTVHSGEMPHNAVEAEIEFTLEYLKPQRIGHGIQIHKFPNLAKIAKCMGIHFELCISSNLATKAIASKSDYANALKKFIDWELDYSINTDSSCLLDTHIANENTIHEELLKYNMDQNNCSENATLKNTTSKCSTNKKSK